MSDRSYVRTIARLIRDNQLHETNREDTIGILMRCGVFLEMGDGELVQLAQRIDDEIAGGTL